MFKEGLKRKLAMDFDEEFLQELCKVEGIEPRDVFEWARGEPAGVDGVGRRGLQQHSRRGTRQVGLDRGSREQRRARERPAEDPPRGIKHVPFRREDERYRHPEIIEEKEKNVVVVNIRDVSGSMREKKRELVERTFTPLDWYLQGKYDNAEFVYIAHDADAWEVERDEFFGIRSGGGTKISSAYELANQLLEEYPWSDWNRYVFAAGDSENSSNDTGERVIP